MRKRLLIIGTAFCVSFILMVILSLYSMERFTTYSNYANLTDHTNTVIQRILRTELSLRDIDRAERGYMITNDTMYLRFFNNAIDSIQYSLENIASIISNPKQQNNIALLKSSIAIRVAAARDNIAYVDTASSASPSKYYFESRQLMVECSRRLNALASVETEILKDRYAKEQFYLRITSSALKNLLVIFCVITPFLFIIMIKELRGRMRYQP